MKRRGVAVFVFRAVKSLGNGLFLSKIRRHVARLSIVRIVEEAIVRRFCPVDGKRVVFATFSGGCCCNPKAVARALALRRPDVDIVWLLDYSAYTSRKGVPDTGRAVPKSTWRAFKAMATSAVMVENAQVFVGVGKPAKRAGQLYVNTWHGSLGIKRLDTACDAVMKNARRRAKAIDVLLTNSTFEEEVFRTSLFPDVPLVRTGHPRNDVFFLPDQAKGEIRKSVFGRLGLPADAKLALFAPTFRENAFAEGSDAYDFKAWAAALSDRFGGNWTVAVRLHPHDAKALAEGLIKLPDDVFNVSDFEDIQELLVAADAGITDYSSWIFDFLLGGHPGFIYAPDKAKYDESRGFYYPLEETPFPVATDQAGLCAAIRAFDAEAFVRDRGSFLAARGCMEDGHASDRVIDMIVAHLDRIGGKGELS